MLVTRTASAEMRSRAAGRTAVDDVSALRFWMGSGRRRKVRRSTDRQRVVILDRYSPKLFAVIVGILFLSLLDAVLTLYLMEHGSNELNPVMDYFLKKGPLIFTIAKYLLTSVAVIIFVILANSVVPRFKFRAKRLFPYALIAFGSVIVWEVILVYIVVVWKVAAASHGRSLSMVNPMTHVLLLQLPIPRQNFGRKTGNIPHGSGLPETGRAGPSRPADRDPAGTPGILSG